MPNDQKLAAFDSRLRKIELLLNAIVFQDKYYFNKDIALKEGARIIPVGAGGLRVGNASSSHLGFFGATPVDRPDTVADPALGAINGSDTVSAATILANEQALETAIEAIIDRLQELGLIA